ncbi:lasso RiPP family leader peptide-containing protein [uncultured Georgenia sp.]|nr:lasso RiPP family leader peptide-containing protein [uncultured Georgenia sp.]HLV04717.1 lasso RiPP family leader peptide-containing protein [Actinomycetaceae bacterium]
MERYEAPTLTEVGSIREMTLGGTNLQDWSDEIRLWKIVIPLPGEFS